ncbi:hypothetical protein GUJ93_ZPchr0001g32124 [Zizania palustris]|uniref:Uncharacterized protein n=1 Tax=Zizania palustris TaxID=103762 RepID=A0A8J5RXU4_ZIZPA|nr:hypothetical protein GUJ93_ZPchr0001g32124 [Zizania palustris]
MARRFLPHIRLLARAVPRASAFPVRLWPSRAAAAASAPVHGAFQFRSPEEEGRKGSFRWDHEDECARALLVVYYLFYPRILPPL